MKNKADSSKQQLFGRIDRAATPQQRTCISCMLYQPKSEGEERCKSPAAPKAREDMQVWLMYGFKLGSCAYYVQKEWPAHE